MTSLCRPVPSGARKTGKGLLLSETGAVRDRCRQEAGLASQSSIPASSSACTDGGAADPVTE